MPAGPGPGWSSRPYLWRLLVLRKYGKGTPKNLTKRYFPSYKTVYDYYAKWGKDGTTESIHDTLRHKVRAAAGRSDLPACCTGSHRVKWAASSEPTGCSDRSRSTAVV